MRAFTRFSVAMLGCPVEGFASNTFAEIRAGDVKALVLPWDEPVDMRIITPVMSVALTETNCESLLLSLITTP